MGTPDNTHVKIAETCPHLLLVLKDASAKVASLVGYMDSMCSYQRYNQYLEGIQKTINKAIEHSRRICELILSENTTNKEAYKFEEEGLKGLHKIENISCDTSPRVFARSGSLIAKIGYKECLEKLKGVRVKDRKNRIVYTGAACQCFGFTGTGHNFLSVWSRLREFGTNKPLKTYGILRFDVMNKGYKWDELFDFAKEYYLNYHALLCKHLFGGKGLYVKRIGGEWHLKSDFDQQA